MYESTEELLKNDSYEKHKYRLNNLFLKRNDRFWSLLYPYLNLSGPKTLPFETNFCIGSGQSTFKDGKPDKQPWFNLGKQNFQPSTPSQTEFFTHNYDDAFEGGNSLHIQTKELIRLFTCGFTCDHDVIFTYTYKRFSLDNDLKVKFNIIDSSSDKLYTVECNAWEDNNDAIKISPLNSNELKIVAEYLSRNYNARIPDATVEEWTTKSFLLKFKKNQKCVITDIGVGKKKTGKILLGKISLFPAKHLGIDYKAFIE